MRAPYQAPMAVASWLTVLSCTALPLLVAAGLAFLAARLEARAARVAAGSLALVVLLAGLSSSWMLGGYLLACHLDAEARGARTRTELESRLYLSSHSDYACDALPSDSWARAHRCASGDHVRRYRVLHDLPIDVVYAADDRVLGVFSSYE